MAVYKHPVQIQVLDDNERWQNIAQRRAKITGTGGREYGVAGTEQSAINKNFRIRYEKELAELAPQSCRILYKNMVYDVQVIDDFEERHFELVFKTVAKFEH